jgi:dihydroflavonol-4-reductase
VSILVTGATGLLGSVLTRQLVAEGADVRILRRTTSSLDLLGGVSPRVEHALGDVRDARSLARAMDGVERVYHVAAKIGFASGDRNALRRVNVGGTANVVNAALATGVKRLVHTSSIAALGPPASPRGVVDETNDWPSGAAPSAYAQSKHDAELEVHRGIAEGLDAVIVNPSLVFGVGRAGANTRRIVDAVRNGWAKAAPPGRTNVVDVHDAAAGHRAAMARGTSGRRYILGSENLPWMALLRTLAAAFGVEPPRRTLPPALLKGSAALAEALAFVTRTDALFSRSLAHAALRQHTYSARRARNELGCTFRPFASTARRLAQVLAPTSNASA